MNRLIGGLRRWVTQNLSETATTYRATIEDTKRGKPVIHLPSIRSTIITPMDVETRKRMILESEYEIYQVFVAGKHDVLRGDVWEQGGVRYNVRKVEWWGKDKTAFALIGLEEVKSGYGSPS